ncbi:MAG TPA: NAD-dependent epimerase/dehydratase family protein [Candidatus Tectomicrobia bacterium]|nr:NAD-dependent epimerase/dehydratase family protein [Candidatus Tectomicrobia bacterium]
MRVLVTGGTGFTGSHLARRLLQEGHDVVVLDTQPGLFARDLERLGAEIVLGSVADGDVVRRAARGCELVYHLAAAFRKVNLPRAEYWRTNVEGTRHVMEAAVDAGARKVIYCSTCGVHGDVKRWPADESAPIAPEDYYQRTKYEGERVVHEFVARGVPAVILRPAAIYGPGDPERFLMLFRRVRTGRFPMFGDGRVHYHPLYIDNLVDAFRLAAQSDRGRGEAYLVADEHFYTLNDLVTAIGEALGIRVVIRHYPFRPLWLAALACELAYLPLPAEPPLFRRRVDWFRQNRAFDITRARLELGYQPKVALREGLAATAAWYRAEGYL